MGMLIKKSLVRNYCDSNNIIDAILYEYNDFHGQSCNVYYSTTINVTETIVAIIMQDGITHSNRDNKGSVYFDWTAPAAGSGPLRFGYTKQCHTIGRQAGRQFQGL